MAYTNSKMVVCTKLSPNHSGLRTHSIDRISPHCVVGQVTAESLGSLFAKSSYKASSNYGIDKNGRVGMYVEEKWCQSAVQTMLTNERYIGDILLQKFCVENHITHKPIRNDHTQIPSYYIENHHTPIIARSQYERVQKIRSMRRMQHSRADAVMGTCIQYPIGDKLRCPYCGSALYQRSLPVQSTRTSGWCCERGVDACRGFIMRSGLIEKALLDAYSTLDERKVKEKLKSPKFSSAAKKALKIKKEHPALTRVDFWWVDELIDHVTFGAHSKEPRELRRLEALGIPYEDDRLVRVYWRCGLITTVPSGVIFDRDHPAYVAKLYNDYLERKAKKEEAV